MQHISIRIALLITLGAVLIGIMGCGTADTPTSHGAVLQTGAAYPVPDATTPAVGSVQTAFAYPAPSGSEITKTAIALRELYAQQTAQARPQPPKGSISATRATPGPSPTTFSPNATPVAGGGTIVVNAQAPFPSIEFLPENKWFIDVEDKRFIVYAGQEGKEHNQDSPTQGMLIVEVKIISTEEIQSTKFYTTPTKTGPARIVDVRANNAGMHLTIQTAGGALYDFDVATGKFTAK